MGLTWHNGILEMPMKNFTYCGVKNETKGYQGLKALQKKNQDVKAGVIEDSLVTNNTVTEALKAGKSESVDFDAGLDYLFS